MLEKTVGFFFPVSFKNEMLKMQLFAKRSSSNLENTWGMRLEKCCSPCTHIVYFGGEKTD